MQKLIDAVNRNFAKIEKAYTYIWEHPETGFKEWKTHAYLAEEFRALGYELVEAGNIPGFYTDLDTGRPGPKVLFLGELDSLVCASHPAADPETSAVHACGHCCQAAGLLGLAAALKEPEVLDDLCGTIRLMAVPAEELIEVEYREQLRQQGIIRYYCGKTEFMYRGYMEGVDMAFMLHTSSGGNHTGSLDKGANGSLTKFITFTGVSAHAGGSPHRGINALYAANQGLNAINALRETFQDASHIRVHPIITSGGTVVNAIPEKVTMESYIRGASMEEVNKINYKVNRALAASAAALGANVILRDRPGYAPRNYDLGMTMAGKEAMEAVLQKVTYNPEGWGTGSSDMGDLTMVMPAIHPGIGGATGTGHGNNYFIADVDAACGDIARVAAALLYVLLRDNAARAKEILANFVPKYPSQKEYLKAVDAITMDKTAVVYHEDGTVTLDFANQA